MIKDSDLRKVVNSEPTPKFTYKSLEKTIENSKRAYFKTQINNHISNKEFLLLQAKFINKKFWIIQLLIVLTIITFLINNSWTDVSLSSRTYFSVMIPLLVICNVPEIFKNIEYNSFEIENCSYFSLKKVYLAKLLIIGMSDLILATFIIFTASKATQVPLYQLIIYFLVPFNSTFCICFTSLALSKKNASQFTSLSLGIVWTVILYILSSQVEIYDLVQSGIWMILIIISMIYISYMMKKIISNTNCYSENIDFN